MLKINDKNIYFPDQQTIAVLRDNISTSHIDEIKKYIYDKDLNVTQTKNKLRTAFENFSPFTVHIFPTSDCNLRCKYCFSDAGEIRSCKLSKTQIDTILCQGAKSMVMANMVTNQEAPPFEVWFGGGGEPTFEWELFCYTIDRAKFYAEKFNYKVKFGLLTNGTLYEPEKLKYIVDNITYVQISYDGIPYIQNMHRPTAKGENSFLLVDSFVKFIMRNNKHFALRATVSDISVKYLEDITEFFCTNYPSSSHIHFEPLTITDRSQRMKFNSPSPSEFIENFLKAMRVGKKYNKSVLTSTMALIDKRDNDSFCDAMVGDTIMLQPNGYLTTCYEAMPYELDDYSIFKAGAISFDGAIKWNNDRNINQLNLNNDRCKKCYCWDFCKGGCAIIKYRGEDGYKYRCKVTKQLTLRLLKILSDENLLCKYRLFPHIILCEDNPYIEKIIRWDETVMGTKTSRLSAFN